MPRLHSVNKARKSPGKCSGCGVTIPKGVAYLWWKFRRSGKYIRCTLRPCRPTRSDMTQSSYYKTLYELQDRTIDGDTMAEVEGVRDEFVSALEDLRDEVQGNRDNMPQQFQDTDELLQGRIDSLEEAINNLGNLDFSLDDSEGTEEGEQAQVDSKKDEISEELGNIQ